MFYLVLNKVNTIYKSQVRKTIMFIINVPYLDDKESFGAEKPNIKNKKVKGPDGQKSCLEQ